MTSGKALRLPSVLVLDEDDQTHSAVEMSAGDFAHIIHASSPVEAFRLLQGEAVDVVVSCSKLGNMDLTHLLCLIKRQHPALANIVVSTDSEHALSRLIEQGKIFRHVAKPLKAGLLRASIKSALEQREGCPVDPAPALVETAASFRAVAVRQTLSGKLLALLHRLWGT